jgi:hypothetical protein
VNQPTRYYERHGAIFRRLLVLVDHLGAKRGALAFAQDWSRLMGLPLVDTSWPMNATVPPECVIGADAQDVVIFGQYRSPAQKKTILRALQRDHAPTMLICPEDPSTLSRVLLLDQINHAPDWLFRMAEQLGPFFSDGLVILTLAHSQRAGQLRQEEVRERLDGMDCEVDFDLLVSHDVRAIRNVAGWRQCSLMVLQRAPQSLWGRLWGDPIEDILNMSGLPPMLAFAHGGNAGRMTRYSDSRQGLQQPAGT